MRMNARAPSELLGAGAATGASAGDCSLGPAAVDTSDFILPALPPSERSESRGVDGRTQLRYIFALERRRYGESCAGCAGNRASRAEARPYADDRAAGARAS